ncbi:DUF1848 domain-containing protein [Clostridium sporogenes]|uniref:DUF1848 domain-containing protein n=2 Tax=Clostridium TaxID=1485 RepID=A0AAU8Z171_CLOBO|nr:DUF1848 domain-containing protein [Clostridium sporogenes]AVP65199.1 DUF1848 domain-containing protein [Clostridium botulinum]MCF4017490.1 DUF1848 domain-containing protein [Clostridium sporogenes]NFF62630.1 DUF1848 domain-containing protein [Clostridium sporogenes]NFG01087.1 DUF1848 domain-containing protein [Clostridium sporogenes]NFH49042.1 DUF1848 domain-containing protein [Clostridium sporogenes]
MILSVSRRTDIPAFYSEWFFNRVKEGFALVRNPFNTKQISRINLSPKVIDCIVFWTKNPKKMIKRLDEIKEYNYYFQFTLNSYDKTLEKNLPKKKYLINTFIELSQKIGKDKVIWRYDPIILTDKFTKEYHYKWFEYLAKTLSPYTNKCIISFLDLYKKTEHNLKKINVLPLNKDDMIGLADKFSKIASKYNLIIETCSEEIELSKVNINHGKCIDDTLISHIIGEKLYIDKDPNQRKICGCVKSIDIGAYNTCNHDCLYCYANFNREMVEKNMLKYSPKSPLLFGNLYGDEQIIDRKIKSYRVGQISFL